MSDSRIEVRVAWDGRIKFLGKFWSPTLPARVLLRMAARSLGVKWPDIIDREEALMFITREEIDGGE